MIQNIILGNGGTFYPGLAFSDNFDKGSPSRFFAKNSYLCFGTKKPNYEWSSTRFYFRSFMENIPQIKRAADQ